MTLMGPLMNQILIMFILMGVGYVLFAKKMITKQGTAELGKILLYVVIPVVIIQNFCIERTPEKVMELLYSILFGAIAMAIAIIISWIFFGKKDGVATFSSAFSNAAFIGIPLVQATIGSEAVFYISMMIVLVNLLQWTFGVYALTKDRSVMKVDKVITNPIVISVAIGMVLFFLNISLPAVVTRSFTIIAGMNTPLAMIISGAYLAQTDLVKMIGKRDNYVVSVFRLLLIPLVTLAAFKLVPVGSVDLKFAILIAAACPVGSNVAIFAQQYDADYTFAVETVCLSTVLCLVTLPLLTIICDVIL